MKIDVLKLAAGYAGEKASHLSVHRLRGTRMTANYQTSNGTHRDGGSRGVGPLLAAAKPDCASCHHPRSAHFWGGGCSQSVCQDNGLCDGYEPQMEDTDVQRPGRSAEQGVVAGGAGRGDGADRAGGVAPVARSLAGITDLGRRAVLEKALAIALEQEREAPRATLRCEACAWCRSGLHGQHPGHTHCRCVVCISRRFIKEDGHGHDPDCRHRLDDACRPVRSLAGLTRHGKRGTLEKALAIALEQEREAPRGIGDGESGGWGALADNLRGALEAWGC